MLQKQLTTQQEKLTKTYFWKELLAYIIKDIMTCFRLSPFRESLSNHVPVQKTKKNFERVANIILVQSKEAATLMDRRKSSGWSYSYRSCNYLKKLRQGSNSLLWFIIIQTQLEIRPTQNQFKNISITLGSEIHIRNHYHRWINNKSSGSLTYLRVVIEVVEKKIKKKNKPENKRN